jgi:probable HAF family extracellular repeat protein
VDLGTLGGTDSSAAALNDANQVAGEADLGAGQRHAYRWSPAQGMVDLGTLGGPTSAAGAINAAGWVAGTASMADGHVLATLWRDTAPLSLGTLGGTDSAATVVNAAGQVGGRANVADGTAHAFLWSEQDGMVDLNTRVGSADLGVLQQVVALAQDGSLLATTSRGTLVLLRPSSP